METDNKIRGRVMRRVWGVYMLRTCMRAEARVAAFTALVLGVASFVSVGDIVSNTVSASSSFNQFTAYAMSALTTTEIGVQLSLIFALFLCALFVRDAMVLIGTPRTL